MSTVFSRVNAKEREREERERKSQSATNFNYLRLAGVPAEEPKGRERRAAHR